MSVMQKCTTYTVIGNIMQRTHFTTAQITSKDGTPISYNKCGAGPGILVLPGALATARDFNGLAHELAQYFTVYTIDRRGRAASGDNKEYSIKKEIEDVEAVRAQTGAEYVFGHSFGGFLALEFARNHKQIKKLVVYEPGISVDGSIAMDWAVSATKYLEQDRPLDAFVEFVRAMNPDSAKAPRWILKRMLPVFIKKTELQQKYALLPGTIREHAEEARLDSTHRNYVEIGADVMLMRGSKINATSPAFEAMTRDISVFQHVTFKKLDHFGPEKDPKAIAKTIYQFVAQ